MRGGALLLVVMLAAGCRRERTHPRLAELTTPIHVTVRAIDAPADCGALSGVEKLKCTTEGAHEGCTFVAVGSNADLPLAFSGPMEKWHCDEQRTRNNTVMLAAAPMSSARLWADARGERVLIDLDTDGWVIFVREAKVVSSRQLWGDAVSTPRRPLLADHSPDWPKVPTLLAAWDTTGAMLGRISLQDVMKDDPDPQENLFTAMNEDAFRFDTQAYSEAYDLLDAPHQALALETALKKVKEGEALSTWFRTRPKLLPRYREALLVALRHNQIIDPEQLNDLSAVDRALLQKTTCELLEETYLEKDLGGLNEPSPAALALIARQKLTCPWVMSWLERLRCHESLTCETVDPAADDGERRRPLCPPETVEATLNAAFHEQPLEEAIASRRFEFDQHGGELLLAAAAAQGPLPAEFIKRTSRRTYEGTAPRECLLLTRPLGQWACELPVTVTTSVQESCRLHLDDAKRTMSFDVLPKPPTSKTTTPPLLEP